MTVRVSLRAAVRRDLRQLVADFAEGLVALLDRRGLFDDHDEEALSERVRRSPDMLAEVCARVLASLRAHRQPVAISIIADDLASTPRQLAHPLALLVERGQVTRTGTRRGTRYALCNRRRAARPPARPPARKGRA